MATGWHHLRGLTAQIHKDLGRDFQKLVSEHQSKKEDERKSEIVNDRTYVITGNYQEFKDYTREKGIKDTRTHQYVRGVDMLRGTRGIHGSFYGRWWSRDDIYAIIEYLQVSDSINIETSQKLHKILAKKNPKV